MSVDRGLIRIVKIAPLAPPAHRSEPGSRPRQRPRAARLCMYVAVITFAFATAAYAAITCPTPADPTDPRLLVMVVHIEEGDGPTAWSLVAYTDGVLGLAKSGKRPFCRRIRDRDLQELTHLVEREEFQAAAEFEGFLGHQEWMQVVDGGMVRRFAAENLPPAVLPVFKELDRLFSNKFGRHYDWPLARGYAPPNASDLPADAKRERF